MRALDTNVLVRCITGDDPQQALVARRLLTHEQGVYISKTVLLELEWVLRAAYRCSRPSIWHKPWLIFPQAWTLPMLCTLRQLLLPTKDSGHSTLPCKAMRPAVGAAFIWHVLIQKRPMPETWCAILLAAMLVGCSNQGGSDPLAGIDSNANGVRDDVEQFMALRAPRSPLWWGRNGRP